MPGYFPPGSYAVPAPAQPKPGTVKTDRVANYPMGRSELLSGAGNAQAQLAYLMAQGYGATAKNQKAAAKAYVKGIPADYWTKVATHNAAMAAHTAAAERAAHAHATYITSHDPNAATAAPSVAVAPPTAVDPAAPQPPLPTLKSLGIPGLNYKSYDPTQLANSQVNSQYDPQITSLVQAMSDAKGQGGQNQADIKAWYAALAHDLGDTTAQDTSSTQDILASHDAGQQGVLNVLGGNVGAANSAAAFGAIDRGALEKIGLSRANYDAALKPAFTSQRNDAALGQLNKDEGAVKDLATQLAAARTAKGQAFSGAFANAEDTNLKNSVAAINAKAQLAMLPYQVQSAGLDVQGKQANIKMAGLQYDTQKLKNSILSGQQSNGPIPVFGKLNPEQLTGLQNQLLSQAVDSKDPLKLAHNPSDVYQAWGAALRSMSGGSWDPQTSAVVNKWRNNLLASRLPSWNRVHPKQQYAFKNGVLVKK